MIRDLAMLCEELLHIDARASSYQGCDHIREVGGKAVSAIERLHSRAVNLEEALVQCAEWFHEYGKMHQAKGALDKAKRNFERAKFALDAVEHKP